MKLKFVYVVTFSLTALAYAGPKSTVTHQPVCDDASAAVPAVKPLLAAVNRLGAGNCPDVSKLVGLCASISSKRQDSSNPNQYSYAFERKIYEAACVNFDADDGITARKKIQTLWSNYPEQMRCQANNFNVQDGHILKYAVETRTFNLLDDATKLWGVNLNIVDPTDNKTVLDYIQGKMIQYAGTEMEPELKRYYDKLKQYGAKHQADL